MASMSPIMLPLLLLVAGCYCAPASWLDIGGTVGYDSVMNGTVGGHLKGQRDGLSINGTGRGIVGASWAPTLIARGHAKAGGAVIAGDASLKTVIDNSWQPGFEGEIGRNSKGEWLLGFAPDSQLYNKVMLTPNIQLKTGEDAKKLMEIPIANEDASVIEAPQQAPMSSYGYAPYGYAPYGYAPYGYAPNGYAPNGYAPNGYAPNGYAPNGYAANSPYAAYANYAQALAQAQAQAPSEQYVQATQAPEVISQ